MFKTYEYRLYPNRGQRKALMACLKESRHLYNEMLEQVADYYDETGKFLFKYSLSRRFRGCGGGHVPASRVQTLVDRLDKALRRYVARKKRGKQAGFPRFRSANRWHSIHLRQYGKGRDVRLEDGRLYVPGKLGKSIKTKQHRPLEGKPKTVYLVLRANAKWYALVVCDLGEAPPAKGGPVVGLDVGLRVFLADSEGSTIASARCYQACQKKLRRAQRKLCRRRKGSNRRKKSARAVARLHLKTARQRKDFLHKVARRYVDRYGTIVVEDLNVAGMVKNRHLAKAIHDAGWSKFVKILEGKAEETGSRVIKVPARFTTQRCSKCGQLVPKPLSVETHRCAFCGYTENRDVNAAKNILLAWTGPSGQNVKECLERVPRSRLL
jgi:putative transposase